MKGHKHAIATHIVMMSPDAMSFVINDSSPGINKNHLYKLLEEYIEYYNKDGTHYSLDKDPPSGRPVLKRNSDEDKVIALPRVGGLHYKYLWKDAD